MEHDSYPGEGVLRAPVTALFSPIDPEIRSRRLLSSVSADELNRLNASLNLRCRITVLPMLRLY